MTRKVSIHVVIANQYRMINGLLSSALSEESDIMVVGVVDDDTDLTFLLRNERVDIVLIDSCPGPRDSFDLTAQCNERGVGVLVFLRGNNASLAPRYLKAGARGCFCPVNADLREMISAIRRVHAGRIYLSDEFHELVLRKSFDKTGDTPDSALTRREFQVMRGVAQGFTGSEIAKNLFISEKTVSTHRANLMRKLGLRNNVALTHFAIRNGFIQI